MKKIKQDVRQICHALQQGEITVEDAKRLADDLDQDIIRYQRRTIVLGTILIFLSFFLAGIVCQNRPQAAPLLPGIEQTVPKEHAYIPRYTLPMDSLWVITYQQKALDSDLAVSTNQPFSEQWVKYAAYQLIIGKQALEEHMPDEAVLHLEKALTVFPQIQGVHGVLGTVYLEMNQTGPAVTHLEAALKEGATLPVLNNLGAALINEGELDRAENFLLQATEMDPGFPGTLKNLALLYREKEQPEKSLRYFEEYLTRYHEDTEAAEIYANYLMDLNRHDQAVDFLENFSQENPENALPLYILLAKIEVKLANTEAAVAALQKMTDYISPNLALTKLNMDDFDPIRDTEEFKALVHQVELAMVTLEEKR